MAKNLLVDQNMACDLREAEAFILSGIVYLGDTPIDKPGMLLKADSILTVKKKSIWVSRAGFKLEHALTHFNINVEDDVCLDIGASTGGFTQALLHYGAKFVYAVDVGYNELDYRLQIHPAVKNLNRTNAKHLNSSIIPEIIDTIVCDVSFISLMSALPSSFTLTSENAKLITLIKPQFEAEYHEVNKGIVTDHNVQLRIINQVKTWLTKYNWHIHGVTPSPILGRRGNQEFLLYATKSTG